MELQSRSAAASAARLRVNMETPSYMQVPGTCARERAAAGGGRGLNSVLHRVLLEVAVVEDWRDLLCRHNGAPRSVFRTALEDELEMQRLEQQVLRSAIGALDVYSVRPSNLVRATSHMPIEWARHGHLLTSTRSHFFENRLLDSE